MTEQTAINIAAEALQAAHGTLEQVKRETTEVLTDVASRMRSAANLVECGEAEAAIALLRTAAEALDSSFLAGVGVGQIRN